MRYFYKLLVIYCVTLCRNMRFSYFNKLNSYFDIRNIINDYNFESFLIKYVFFYKNSFLYFNFEYNLLIGNYRIAKMHYDNLASRGLTSVSLYILNNYEVLLSSRLRDLKNEFALEYYSQFISTFPFLPSPVDKIMIDNFSSSLKKKNHLHGIIINLVSVIIFGFLAIVFYNSIDGFTLEAILHININNLIYFTIILLVLFIFIKLCSFSFQGLINIVHRYGIIFIIFLVFSFLSLEINNYIDSSIIRQKEDISNRNIISYGKDLFSALMRNTRSNINFSSETDKINVFITQFYPTNQKSLVSSDYTKTDISRIIYENLLQIKDSYININGEDFNKIINLKYIDNIPSIKQIESLFNDAENESRINRSIFLSGEYFEKSENIFVSNYIKLDCFNKEVLKRIMIFFRESSLFLKNKIMICKTTKNKSDTILNDYCNIMINDIIKMIQYQNYISYLSYISDLQLTSKIFFYYIKILINLNNNNIKEAYNDLEYLCNLFYCKDSTNDQQNKIEENNKIIYNNDFLYHIHLLKIFCNLYFIDITNKIILERKNNKYLNNSFETLNTILNKDIYDVETNERKLCFSYRYRPIRNNYVSNEFNNYWFSRFIQQDNTQKEVIKYEDTILYKIRLIDEIAKIIDEKKITSVIPEYYKNICLFLLYRNLSSENIKSGPISWIILTRLRDNYIKISNFAKKDSIFYLDFQGFMENNKDQVPFLIDP